MESGTTAIPIHGGAQEGKANGNADALSQMEPERCCAQKKKEENVTTPGPLPVLGNSLDNQPNSSTAHASRESGLYKSWPTARSGQSPPLAPLQLVSPT